MKKFTAKHLIALLVILTSFGVLAARAQENQATNDESYLASFQETALEAEAEVPQLAICDHNKDGLRNLTDVAMFAGCKDTFDADNNGVHDLSDISLYTSMNQNDDFCNGIGEISFDCVAQPRVENITVVEVPQLAICDHNRDGLRNLTDVAIFAGCKDTFDANGDGVHNISDIPVYTSNNQNNDFCYNDFKCTPDRIEVPVEPIIEEPIVSRGSSNSGLAICDHNNDGYRNLTDVSMFASCQDTFDANNDGVHNLSDVALYTSMNQNNDFCYNDFVCSPTTTPQVLGIKEVNCKIDKDVAGQTQWADGSLIRGCDMKVYRIENQEKHYIKNLQELFRYIGQRIYNVADEVVNLF